MLRFGFVWSVLISTVVAIHLVFYRHWHFDTALLDAVLPYFIGGFLGGCVSLKVSARRSAEANIQFCKLFVSLVAFTLLFSQLYLFIGHQIFFTETPFMRSPIAWLKETLVAFIASVILFVLTGLRPLLPWGIILAFALSISFSRGRWPAQR